MAGIFDTFTLAESAELTFGYVLAEEEERQNQRSLRFQLFQVDIFDAVNIKSDSNCSNSQIQSLILRNLTKEKQPDSNILFGIFSDEIIVYRYLHKFFYIVYTLFS